MLITDFSDSITRMNLFIIFCRTLRKQLLVKFFFSNFHDKTLICEFRNKRNMCLHKDLFTKNTLIQNLA